MSQQLRYEIFPVGETFYCAWGWDIDERNLQFLDSIEPEYFDYLAQQHLAAFEESGSEMATVALRTSYYHGLETFFALLFAGLQAPRCIEGWLLKYWPKDLRDLVRKVHSAGVVVPMPFKADELSWSALSGLFNRFGYEDEDKLQETHDLFGKLWGMFASDFLSEDHRKEYNSLKHGFRLQSGGFGLKLGLEPSPGESPPPEEMQDLGGSKYGSSFPADEPIAGDENGSSSPHFQIQEHAVNWDPEGTANGLALVALSISNLVSGLKILTGEDPQTVQFRRPEDPEQFSKPWNRALGVRSMQLRFPVREEQIRRWDRDELEEQFTDHWKRDEGDPEEGMKGEETGPSA